MPDWVLDSHRDFFVLEGETKPFVHRFALIGEGAEHRDHWHKGEYLPRVGPGATIGAFCAIDRGLFRHTSVGARTKLLKMVRMGHDAQVGDDCEIAASVGIGGEVTIYDKVVIGMGAQIRPRVTIGEGARIGMGSVVLYDIPAGETWVGNPAQLLYDNKGERPDFTEEWEKIVDARHEIDIEFGKPIGI